MAKVAITEQYLENIADAIRSKTGMSTATYYPAEMASAIMTISGSGGITPTGTISITENGTYNVTSYASAEVEVPTGSTINNQNKTVNPSTSQQSITADSGYTGLGTVTVTAMPSGTAGTPTASKGTVSNHSISVTPSVTNTTGYITGGTKNGTAVTVSASELVSGSQTVTTNDTYDVTNLAELVVDVSGGSVTWVTEYDGNATIVADSPNYVVFNNWAPTHPAFVEGQTWRVTWNGTQYICPVEIGSDQAQTRFIGNKGIVGYTGDDSNEPFFGYMRTSTQLAFVTTDPAGTIPLKMELQQSSSATLIEKTITTNGTYDAEDDDADGYSKVTVNVSSSPTIQSLSITPSTSQQTFNASNVDGYKPVTVAAMATMTLPTSATASATSGYTSKATISRSTSDQYINIAPGYNSAGGYYKISAVANGSASGPTTVTSTGANVSTGSNTLTLTKTNVTTTPTVSAGYVSSATASTATVTLTASVTTKAAATYHPSTTAQTIAASQYLTGAQTIAAVTTSNLSASNIVSGVTIKVGDSSDDDCVASVTGSVVLQNYYTGSSAPSSSLGSNGDLYLQS